MVDAVPKAGKKGGIKKKEAPSEADQEEEIVMLHGSDEEQARPPREGKRGPSANKEEELRRQRQAQQRKVRAFLLGSQCPVLASLRVLLLRLARRRPSLASVCPSRVFLPCAWRSGPPGPRTPAPPL